MYVPSWSAVRRCVCTILLVGGFASPSAPAEDAKLRVLILSGANNHAWQQTTPVIKAALEESGRFRVDVEDNVAGMQAQAFDPYAVIVSNFNTFGKDPALPVWDAAVKQAFIGQLRKGHGLVIVHAGSSMFYDWPDFQQLARGFAIFLGHDATAMKNTAWRSLLQRGTEWAATAKVTLPPAKDWPATQADAERMAK